MASKRTATRRRLLQMAPAAVVTTLMGGALANAQSPTASASHKQSPPTSFLISGTFRASALDNLRRCNIEVVCKQIKDIVIGVQGEVPQFFLIGGSWKMVMIVNLRAATSTDLVYRLLATELFTTDFSLSRLLSAADFDHMRDAAGSLKLAWPR